MSAPSASPHTERTDASPAAARNGAGPAPAHVRTGAGIAPPLDSEGREQALERLIGVRSSKPSFYAAWRDNAVRLDRSIETLERISSALCAAPDGPDALCDAVVQAAAHHFDAPWAAMMFDDGAAVVEPAHVARRSDGRIAPAVGEFPPALAAVTERALEAQRPVLTEAAVAAPMPVRGELVGVLAVGLPPDAVVETSDLSILVTLANHAGVALHNAWLFQESEQLRLRSEAVSRLAEARAAELERRSRELDGIRLRLENAGRRELLSQERNRIARELHDSVAQQLLTIGMNLEWCRRHESTAPPVLARVTAAKSLARAAVDEIRSVIFELASDGQVELRQALRDVIGDVVVGTNLKVGLRSYGQAQPISGATQHALVQIAREALFNVVRHASARHAWLTLRWESSQVRLIVGDDGDGDPRRLQAQLSEATPEGRHFGLAGIAERVRELGGTVAFRRRRGGGVSLSVQVPLGGAGGGG